MLKEEEEPPHSQKTLETWTSTSTSSTSTSSTSSDSDAIYDTFGAKELFPLLPVQFRNVGELKSDGYDDEEQNMIHERGLLRARVKLQRHANELEHLHGLLDESTLQHDAEIKSMKHQFHDESQKQEDLLEKALEYAELMEKESQKREDLIEKALGHAERLEQKSKRREDLLEKTLSYIEKLESSNKLLLLKPKLYEHTNDPAGFKHGQTIFKMPKIYQVIP